MPRMARTICRVEASRITLAWCHSGERSRARGEENPVSEGSEQDEQAAELNHPKKARGVHLVVYDETANGWQPSEEVSHPGIPGGFRA